MGRQSCMVGSDLSTLVGYVLQRLQDVLQLVHMPLQHCQEFQRSCPIHGRLPRFLPCTNGCSTC